MGIDSASLAKLTKTEILADLIQRALYKDTVMWPLAADLSSRLGPGQRFTTIPRSLSKSTSDINSSGTELVDNSVAYKKDTLEINKFKTVYDYIYDVDKPYSVVDLKQDFFVEAAPAMAEKLEADLVASVIAAGGTTPESAVANPNKFQLAGTDSSSNLNQALTLTQLSSLNQKMSEANVPKAGRYLFLSPKQVHELRILANITDASQFGSRDGLVNGEIARLHGFTVVESNHLSANQVIAMHVNSIVKAMSKNVTIDEERQASKKRDFVSIDAHYGVRVIRDGEHIWFGNELP